MRKSMDLSKPRNRLTAALLAPVLAVATTPETSAQARLLGQSAAILTEQASPSVLRIQQPGFSAQAVRATAGQTVRIPLSLPSQDALKQAGAKEGSFILVRDIPDGVALSDGIPVNEHWVISLNQARSLKMTVSPETTGSFSIGFLLIGPGNRVLAETTLPLTLTAAEDARVASVPAEPRQAPAISDSPVEKQTPEPETAEPLSPRMEATLLTRGIELMKQGNVSAARLVFEKLATRGSANGALALAQTYDPAFVPTSAASAISPDVSKALEWYQRASDLGSRQARGRLAALQQRAGQN